MSLGNRETYSTMEKWTLTWTKLTALDNQKIAEIPDSLPGVYRLSYKHDDGNYYVFYVGQSEDIKTRLQAHLSSSEPNVCIKNYSGTKACFFRYAQVARDYVRSATERQMYKRYQPSCNDQEPQGRDDVEVNLA